MTRLVFAMILCAALEIKSQNIVSGIGLLNNETHLYPNVSTPMHLLPPNVNLTVKLTLTTCNVLLLLGALLGNVLVIQIVRSNVRMRTTTNILIMNMAISDLWIALMFIPSQTIRIFIGNAWVSGILGTITCKAVMSSRLVSVACSTLSLVAIAIDRYKAVARPFHQRTCHNSYRTKVFVCVIWLLSLLICIPPMSSYKLVTIDDDAYCTAAWLSVSKVKIYILGGFLVTFISPLVIITILYLIIANKLQLRNLTIPANEIFQKRAIVTSRHVNKMMVTVVISFALCMLPIQVYLLVRVFRIDAMTTSGLFWGLNATVFISNFNTFINPCIYANFNEQFKRGFKKLLCCHKENSRLSSIFFDSKVVFHRSCKISSDKSSESINEKKDEKRSYEEEIVLTAACTRH